MGPAFSRKYGVLLVTGTTAIRIPMIKRAVVDYAVGADWTPAAGDVKINIDGAGPASVTNLPTAVASGNGAYWEFILTAVELTCKQAIITIVDAATKAVEDNAFLVETYGNASAMYAADLSAANLPVDVKAINAVSTSPVTTVKAVQGLTTADTIATYTGNTVQTGDGFARLGAPAGASVSADIAAIKSETDTILTDVNTGGGAIYSRLGAPAGASMSADIAAAKADTAAIKVQTDKLTFTVPNQVDVNVVDWKGAAAPAMTGDAFARLGAPAGASTAADIAAVKTDTAAIKAKTDNLPEGLKKNTALANFELLMVLSADHVTGAPGLTVAGAVSLDGAAFIALTNTPATEVANGVYKINLAAADVNCTFGTFKFTSATADARFVHFKTTL